MAIANERHAAEAEISRTAEREADPVAALNYLANTFFQHLDDDGQEEERRVGVQLWAEAFNNKRLLSVSLEGMEEPKRVLIALLERLKAAGDLAPDFDTESLARLMVATFQGLVLQKCRERDLDVNASINTLTIIMQSLLRPRIDRKSS